LAAVIFIFNSHYRWTYFLLLRYFSFSSGE